MSTALGIILRRVAGVASGHVHQPAAAGLREDISRLPLNGGTEPDSRANGENSPPPAPIHPRMGGPFSGKIRWKAK
jgi:hypothetical protein